jgi:hypothetical protein
LQEGVQRNELPHRLLPSAEALVARQLPEQVLAAIVGQVPLPQFR